MTLISEKIGNIKFRSGMSKHSAFNKQTPVDDNDLAQTNIAANNKTRKYPF